jgi:hypothetical protein
MNKLTPETRAALELAITRILPGAEFEEDEDGQIIICSGVIENDLGELEPYEG